MGHRPPSSAIGSIVVPRGYLCRAKGCGRVRGPKPELEGDLGGPRGLHQLHEGQHPPIVDQDLWDRVQQSLREHLGSARTKTTRQSSEALLAGKLFDDRGNRMSPTWARKGSKRWRYYVSQAALQGDKSKAGSIVRVPAPELEALVTEAVGKLSADHPASQTDIRDRIDRVAIGGTAIRIRLSGEMDSNQRYLSPYCLPCSQRRPYHQNRPQRFWPRRRERVRHALPQMPSLSALPNAPPCGRRALFLAARP